MGGRVTATVRALLAVTVGVLCALAGAGPAAAHNSLTGSNPKDGARLAEAPKSVRLTFLSALDPDTTVVTLTGPGGDAAAGPAKVSGNRVTVPLAAGPAGEYTAAYEVASGDGHPVKGRIRFTLTAAAGSAAAPAGSAPAATEPAAPSPAVPSSPAASPSPDGPAAGPAADLTAGEGDAGTPWWPWALGGAVLLAAAGTGAFLSRRRAG